MNTLRRHPESDTLHPSPFRAPQRDRCRGPRSLPTCARRGLRKESAIATDDADDRQLIEEQGGGWPEARARFWTKFREGRRAAEAHGSRPR